MRLAGGDGRGHAGEGAREVTDLVARVDVDVDLVAVLEALGRAREPREPRDDEHPGQPEEHDAEADAERERRHERALLGRRDGRVLVLQGEADADDAEQLARLADDRMLDHHLARGLLDLDRRADVRRGREDGEIVPDRHGEPLAEPVGVRRVHAPHDGPRHVRVAQEERGVLLHASHVAEGQRGGHAGREELGHHRHGAGLRGEELVSLLAAHLEVRERGDDAEDQQHRARELRSHRDERPQAGSHTEEQRPARGRISGLPATHV